jgi:iron complex outermembrane recepter protein
MRHSITAIGRYMGSYEDLAYENVFETGNDFVRSIATDKIDSYSTLALQYTYAHEWANENLGTNRSTRCVRCITPVPLCRQLEL